MIKALFSLGLLFSLIVSPLIVDAATRVSGYFRKDGTYVRPHYRSNPDGNPYNNYSFPGNTNPYTGETATGDPQTYLENYRTGSGTSYSPTTSSYSVTPAPTTPSVSPIQAKYKNLAAAPKWVEYVGQSDACAHVYDAYGQNLAKLKSQYSPAPYQKLYTESRVYDAAVISYNSNNARLDREIEAFWSEAEQNAYRCYQGAQAAPASTLTAAAATATKGSEVSLATMVELFIALGIIPAEKAEQARFVLNRAPAR